MVKVGNNTSGVGAEKPKEKGCKRGVPKVASYEKVRYETTQYSLGSENSNIFSMFYTKPQAIFTKPNPPKKQNKKRNIHGKHMGYTLMFRKKRTNSKE